MRRLLISLSLCLACFSLSAAQETPPDSPLLALLRQVPDQGTARYLTLYLDRSAITRAYAGTLQPANVAQGIASLQADDDDLLSAPQRAWWAVYLRVNPPVMADTSTWGNMPSVMGIEFFQIERELGYGEPPGAGLIIQGNFDRAAVETAWSARDYQSTEAGIWCYQADCTTSATVMMDKREVANLFGGRLGRQEALLITDDTLQGSADAQLLAGAAQALNGEARSLADDSAYRAAVQTLESLGILTQATFIDGKTLLVVQDPPLLKADDLVPIREGFQAIPPYRLLALASVVSPTEELGISALVFPNASQATLAAEQMRRRYQQGRDSDADWAIPADWQVTLNTQVVEVEGWHVAVFSLSAPVIPSALLPALRSSLVESGGILPEGIYAPATLYKVLQRTLFTQTSGPWLITTSESALPAP